MKREELEALARVIEEQLAQGQESVIAGTWTIRFDRGRGAFTFDKCENEGYCEERPAVVGTDGKVIDPGGPLFE